MYLSDEYVFMIDYLCWDRNSLLNINTKIFKIVYAKIIVNRYKNSLLIIKGFH